MIRDAQIGEADRGTLVLVEQVVTISVRTMRLVSKLYAAAIINETSSSVPIISCKFI